MRSDILASAVLCDVQIVVKQAQKKFRDWMDKGIRIPPNLREVVYMAGEKCKYQLHDWLWWWYINNNCVNGIVVIRYQTVNLRQFETSQHRQILGSKVVTILNKNNKICILGGGIKIMCLKVKSLSAV